MRPQQQNRRMRGRGNNPSSSNNNQNQNRKGPNPLTRSYESNGPDVKIRGSAQQIAEKYTTLARDAQTSGDRVMAENYLQHAEHYNRLIMAAQAQMPQQQQFRDARDDDDQDEDGDEFGNNNGGQQDQPAQQQNRQRDDQPVQHQNRHRDDQPGQHRNNGSGPQPVIDGVPAEVALKQGGLNQTGAAPVGTHDDQPSATEPVAEGAGEETAEAGSRRPRRPRRSRNKSGDQPEAGDEQAAAGEEPVIEAAQ